MTPSATETKRLGKRLRALRLERGLSQQEMAEPEYTAAYVSIVEQGKRRPSHEALTHFAGRLGLTLEQLVSGRDPNEDLQLEIRIQRATAQIHAGDALAQVKELEDARKQAKSSGHNRALLRAEEGLGHAFYQLGRYNDALDAYERAAALSMEDGAEAQTNSVVGMARCEFRDGKVRAAIHRLESHLIELKRSEPDPTALVQVYAALIPAYFESGMTELAQDAASEGWRLSPSVEDPEHRACLYVNRASLFATQGKRREALTSLALAEDLYRQLGWHSEMTKVSIGRVLRLIDGNELEEAERVLRSLITALDDVSTTDQARVLNLAAQVARLQGDAEQGLAHARRALRVAGKEVPTEAAEANREAGLCAHKLGDHDGAVRSWRRALKIYKQVDNAAELAKTARLIGDHLREAGDADAANEIYRDALDALGELL